MNTKPRQLLVWFRVYFVVFLADRTPAKKNKVSTTVLLIRSVDKQTWEF
jgi:hypothetical protein